MKTLLILRHGKAEGYNADGDHERALADRGVNDASHMGELIGEIVPTIDRVVSSDAARAAQTARLAAAAAKYIGEIDFHSELYGASSDFLLQFVQKLPHRDNTVLLVGHNPGIEELAADLTSMDIGLPTCGLARVELPSEWNDADIRAGTLVGVWTPKEL